MVNEVKHEFTFDDPGSQAIGAFYADIEIALRVKGTNLTQICRQIIKRHLKQARDPELIITLEALQKKYALVPELRQLITEYRGLVSGELEVVRLVRS
jgi:hypothetical protein